MQKHTVDKVEVWTNWQRREVDRMIAAKVTKRSSCSYTAHLLRYDKVLHLYKYKSKFDMTANLSGKKLRT